MWGILDETGSSLSFSSPCQWPAHFWKRQTRNGKERWVPIAHCEGKRLAQVYTKRQRWRWDRALFLQCLSPKLPPYSHPCIHSVWDVAVWTCFASEVMSFKHVLLSAFASGWGTTGLCLVWGIKINRARETFSCCDCQSRNSSGFLKARRQLGAASECAQSWWERGFSSQCCSHWQLSPILMAQSQQN